LFNARQYASNFDEEKIKEVIHYAHVRDVNVYQTMNILISDSEMREALKALERSYLAGIDGVIVQDIGLASLIRKLYPDLALHASTQMTVYNLQGVKLLEELGFKRVVLARELSLEEIQYITENTSLEVEVLFMGVVCLLFGTMPYEQYYWRKKRKPRKMCPALQASVSASGSWRRKRSASKKSEQRVFYEPKRPVLC